MVALIAGLALMLFGLFYVLVFPLTTIACMAYATAGRISLRWAALRCGLLVPLLMMVFAPVHIEPIGPVSWWLLHLEALFGPHPLVMKGHEIRYPETLGASLMVCGAIAAMVLYYRAVTRPADPEAGR